MKKYTTLVLTLVSLTIFAQQGVIKETLPDNNVKADFSIAMVPQYAIMGGMRVDFEKKIRPNQYLLIGPQFYLSNSSDLYPPSDASFKGGGLKLTYKLFPGNKSVPRGGYVGFGLDYKYMDISFMSDEYYAYEAEGVEYYSVESMQTHRYFNQGGFDMIVGYQPIISDYFYLDFYVGWGLRVSDYDPNAAGNSDSWASTIFDPGYSGFVPLGGFRIGIFFN